MDAYQEVLTVLFRSTSARISFQRFLTLVCAILASSAATNVSRTYPLNGSCSKPTNNPNNLQGSDNDQFV
ncbi:hypothetical protein SprV_0200534200 [Sparganum proliferum]